MISLIVHSLFAILIILLPSEQTSATSLPPLEITERKLPEKKIEQEPISKKATEDLMAAVKVPPTLKKRAVQTEAPPPPKPEAPAAPPQSFGIELSGTTLAPAGTGVAVPVGQTLAADPKQRITTPKKETAPSPASPGGTGFKKEYAQGENAPIAVISTPPKVLTQVSVEYPESMKELGIEGKVILELKIDEKGRVISVRLIKGLRPEFDEVAKTAATRLVFSPAMVNGTPVSITLPYTFTFVLD